MDRTRGSKIFTIIDLWSAYHQVLFHDPISRRLPLLLPLDTSNTLLFPLDSPTPLLHYRLWWIRSLITYPPSWRHPNFLQEVRRTCWLRASSSVYPTESQLPLKTCEVQMLPSLRRILRTHSFFGCNQSMPSKGWRCEELAGPNGSQFIAKLPGIHELLPKVHPWFC